MPEVTITVDQCITHSVIPPTPADTVRHPSYLTCTKPVKRIHLMKHQHSERKGGGGG